jgi:DNA-binding transcriptional regulator YiaG
MTIDLKSTIELTGGRISKAFLAKSMGRPFQTVHNWYTGRPIPRDANERLISLFRENGVEPIFL